MDAKTLLIAAFGLFAATGAVAQLGVGYASPAETRAALAEARAQARAAGLRANRLEVEARSAQAAADKTAREAAALAARIQQSEAGIAEARARMGIAQTELATLERRLAERRVPLVRLTAGLQKLARRPLALGILRPGSLRETVYLRALLETTLPEVRRRTAALRSEMDKEDPDPQAIAKRLIEALRAAVIELRDEALRDRLIAAAPATVARFDMARERVRFHAVIDRLEELWREAIT